MLQHRLWRQQWWW